MRERDERSSYQYILGYDSSRRRLRRLQRDPNALWLVRSVAKTKGVALSDLLRFMRGKAAVVDARHLAMYLVHVQLGRSQDVVAFLFGRGRTTVAHACHIMEDRRDGATFEADIATIAANFNQLAAGSDRRPRHA